MSAIPLTILFSLLLAGLFIVLFAHEQRRRRFVSAERDSLLPLADETPHEVAPDRAPDHTPHPAGRPGGGRPSGLSAVASAKAGRDGARPPGADGQKHNAAAGEDPCPESIYF